jgi:hypothetical protein
MAIAAAESPLGDGVAAPPWVRAAAGVSWLLPSGALLLVGLSERADAILRLSRVPGEALVATAVTIAALGLVAGAAALLAAPREDRVTRRRAILGATTSASLLVVAAVAFAAGSASDRDVKRAAVDAMANSPGWNGGARVGDALVSTFEVDASSALAKLLAESLARPYRVVLLSVDNRAAGRAVVVEPASARAHHRSGAAATTAAATDPVHVAAGERVDRAMALFEPDADFRDVDWIVIRIDGVATRVPGRYFTLAEKRRIDALRSGTPRVDAGNLR